ncbi:TetR/AcrR family transcriptional regulator [Piscinibacter sakaiensis]|uniref:TetR/AcrR family transcriptional regulator n=1 Tax=Piscinibacter sakaiensis TaxID=1547922 RepID=UPI003AAA3E89
MSQSPPADLPDAATAPPSAPAPRQRRKQARPHELLAAALTLFGEKGFAATRIEEVAALAGVSKGTLYLYYPSKEALLKAVIREHLGQLLDAGENLVATFDGPTSQLLSVLLHTWWDRVGNTPASAIHKIMLSEARNFPEIAAFYNDEVTRPAQRLLASCLQRGIDRGEFRALPVQPTAMNLLAPVIFLMLHKHSFGACSQSQQIVDPAAVIATQIDLVLHGLLLQGDSATTPVAPPAS